MVEVDEDLDQEQVSKKLEAWALGMQGLGRPDRNRQRSVKEGVILPPGMAMPVVPTSSVPTAPAKGK